MKIEVPKRVKEIIETLQEHGYDAYAVGGCVRDSLLHSSPADWDITTSAKPMEVKALFRRTVDTGLAHGTVTVMLGKEGFEVTTYRIDGEYEDSRHPKEVVFTGDLREDLRRRDFTINAMAYNDREGLVDAFGGIRDLEKGVIRCVGDPYERFTEDALRILRAVRFAAQLGFSIEERTKKAARELAPTLAKISAERIAAELTKLLVSKNPHLLKTAWEAGITRVVLPEFDSMMETLQNTPHHCLNVGEHTLKSLGYVEADKILRFTMLLHDTGKPASRTTDENGRDHFKGHSLESEKIAKNVLQRLKLDNDTIYRVRTLVERQGKKVGLQDSMEDGMRDVIKDGREPSRASIRRAMSQMEPELFDDLLTLKMCLSEAASNDGELRWLRQVRDLTEEIRRNRDCISLKTLAVSGHDIMGAGVKPGREVGSTLVRLLDMVLEEPQRNTKEYLLAHLEQKKGQAGI